MIGDVDQAAVHTRPHSGIMGSTVNSTLGFDSLIFRRKSSLRPLGKAPTVFIARHCFQNKTQATSKQDKDIATARYRAVVNSRKGTR
jgi:hypothetical protein